MRLLLAGALSALLLALSCTALRACSLCGSVQQALTLRQEAAQPTAKMIIYGSISNPRLNSGQFGETDFNIDVVVRSHAFLKDKKVLQVPRYLPVADPKDPPHFLMFCDVLTERLDPYRGVPVKSKDITTYLEAAMKLPADDRLKTLRYFANYLEHSDPTIADDAFLEFAKANDQEIGQLAGVVPAAKLRKWLKDPSVPSNRLNLYAFMLGGCGNAEDAELLHGMLAGSGDRASAAFDGVLAGYILLRPKEGWDAAYAVVQDSGKPYSFQQSVCRCLRFFHGWKPEQNREQILRGLELMLTRNDLADLAMDDMRRWQEWELASRVAALYGKKGFDAPIMRRAVIRYALCCPKTDAKQMLTTARQKEPKTVQDVEESLQYERKPIK